MADDGMIYVRPASGRVVWAESRRRRIWPQGERVLRTPYIARRIAADDLIVIEEQPADPAHGHETAQKTEQETEQEAASDAAPDAASGAASRTKRKRT